MAVGACLKFERGYYCLESVVTFLSGCTRAITTTEEAGIGFLSKQAKQATRRHGVLWIRLHAHA